MTVDSAENQLEVRHLKESLSKMEASTACHQMEEIGNATTRIFRTATKKVEVMKRDAPYSEKK